MAARDASRAAFRFAEASALTSDLFRNGPMIMTMLRPSIMGFDSTVPYSETSSAKR
ncbi:hypothetical protein ACFPRL_05865 [Pseudoclavibacter helvolus]